MLTKSEISYFNVLLIVLLFVRHQMYYFEISPVYFEYGYWQPNLGIMLIPVTGAFGAAYFLGRSTLHLEVGKQIYFLICVVVVISANFLKDFDIQEILFYNKLDYSLGSRPFFIILLPIIFSMLLVHYVKKTFLIICIVLLMLYITQTFGNFIAHYLCIFLTFYLIRRYKYVSSEDNGVFIVNLLFITVIFFTIKFFKIERISIILEFIMIFSFLNITLNFSRLLNKFLSVDLPSPKILTIYIIQALAFSFAAQLNLQYFFALGLVASTTILFWRFDLYLWALWLLGDRDVR